MDILTHAADAPWDGDLEFSIECRPDRAAKPGRQHPIVIHQDWSVSTPHDLEAERIAVAFGGYCSCIELVDRTIPALRASTPLLTRAVRPALGTDAKFTTWRLPQGALIDGCCRFGVSAGVAFRSARTASEHLRSAEHLSRQHGGLPEWQTRAVAQAIEAACTPDLDELSAIARRIREDGGVTELWQAGVHPDELPRSVEAAACVREPLPVSYFLAMTYGSVAPEWLAEVLAAYPSADVASWLAWQAWQKPELARLDAGNWRRWLGYGLSRHEVLIALEKALSGDTAAAVAAASGWSEPASARALVAWAIRDCWPSPEQFGELARRGLDPVPPSQGALDGLSSDVERLSLSPRDELNRTELGLLLVAIGTRQGVIVALADGVRRLAEFADPRLGSPAHPDPAPAGRTR